MSGFVDDHDTISFPGCGIKAVSQIALSLDCQASATNLALEPLIEKGLHLTVGY